MRTLFSATGSRLPVVLLIAAFMQIANASEFDPKAIRASDTFFLSSFEEGESQPCQAAQDVDGDGLLDPACVVSFTPPDPASVAPPLDPTVITDFSVATEFLTTGPNAIQQEALSSAFQPYRVAVMRGIIHDENSQPLPGVLVRSLNHPEYGYTYSRADGAYDFRINGGGDVTLDFQKTGFIHAQRTELTPWKDWLVLDDVTLIAFDSAATVVNFSATSGQQVHRASTIEDADGSRTATLIVPPGTEAIIRRADGSSVPVNTLTLRATEFTVGPGGPARMPATLPETSGYTYAVELSADEAIAQGARSVEFSKPISNYFENFLHFPVGTEIPVGYYDYVYGSWLPSDNGRVIKVLAITGLIAELDVDGSGLAADQAALDALGIDFAEQTRLAALYAAGQELWRTQVRHFSPWDGNFPYIPARPIVEPTQPQSPDANGDTDPNANPGPDIEFANPGPTSDGNSAKDVTDPNCAAGSVIDLDNARLGEFVPIAGTPLSLSYHSARVPGGSASTMTGRLALTPAALPSTLQQVGVGISIAGRTIASLTLPPLPNQFYDFAWDGKDAFGRPFQGWPTVDVTISYDYPLQYVQPRSISLEEYGSAWAAPSGKPFSASNGARSNEIRLSKRWSIPVTSLNASQLRRRGIWDARGLGNGGWSFDQHHVYDPERQMILKGDGSTQKVDANASTEVPTMLNFGGNVAGQVAGPSASIWEFQPGDGGSRFTVPGPPIERFLIQRRRPGETEFEQVIENCPPDPADPNLCEAGTSPSFTYITAWVVDQDDNFIFADGQRLLRVDARSGVLSLIRDSSLAVRACTYRYLKIHNHRIFHACDENWQGMVWPDGSATPLAVGGAELGEDVAVANADIGAISDLDIDQEGNVLLVENSRFRVRRIGIDGRVFTIAGNGVQGIPVNRSLATQSPLPRIEQVVNGRDGSVFLLGGGRVFQVRPSGEIETIIGGGNEPINWAGAQIARSVYVPDQAGLAVLPDGSLVLSASRFGPSSMMRIATGGSFRFQGSEENFIFPSEDARSVFVFAPNGRHLETRNATTGGLIFRFLYRPDGHLIGVEDGDGNLTQIERNAAGLATAVQAPDGQRTLLSYYASGLLAQVNSVANRNWQFNYDPSPEKFGLLSRFQNPNSDASTFVWDAVGRLIRDTNAEGGFTELDRVEYSTLQASLTRVSTAEGRQRVVWSNSAIGRGYRTIETFAGGRSVLSDSSTYSQYASNLDQSQVTIGNTPDPRFGLSAPVSSVSMRLPVPSPPSTITRARAVAATPLGTQLGQLDLQHETLINGRQYLGNYDAQSRSWLIRSPMGRETLIAVDAQERPLQVTEAGLAPLNYAYDPRGRLSGVSAGSGAEQRVWSFSYDSNGYLATITDPLTRLTTLSNDAAGRTLTQTLPDGRAIGFQYDANSNVTAVIPPGRPAHGFVYNAVDQVTAYVPPTISGVSNPATSYSYNLDQIVTGQTRQGSVQLSPQLNPASGLAVGLTTPQGQYAYTRDPVGRIVSEQAPGAIGLRRSFNGPLLASEATDRGATPAAQVDYAYDANLWLQSLQVAVLAGATPTTDSISYVYDNDGLLTAADVPSQPASLTLTRSPQNGLLTGTTLGLVTDSWSYNAFAEPSSYSAAFDATALYASSYSRDKLGRITQKVETVNGSAQTSDYTYDLAGRLDTVSVDGALIADYGYDSNSNRVSVMQTGAGIPSSGCAAGLSNVTASVDAQDRLLTYGNCQYQYTDNGELNNKTDTATSAQTSYQYDTFSNLRHVSLPDGRNIDYTIDGRNRRIGKSINGVVVQGLVYLNDLEPVAETDADGNRIATFVYADRANTPSYLLKNGNVYRMIADHLGSVRLVVNVADGSIAQRLDYDAWGQVLLDTNPGFQPFGFAGGLYDQDTGLVRFGARDYDPETGRWTNKDPIGFAGRASNVYEYCFSSPDNCIDITGLVDLNLFSPGDPLFFVAPTLPVPDGTFSVAAHGNEMVVLDGRSNLPAGPEELARMITVDPNYRHGQSVYLESCSTGKGGENSFANKLSEKLGAPVIAPDSSSWASPFRPTFVAPRAPGSTNTISGVQKTGQFVTFGSGLFSGTFE